MPTKAEMQRQRLKHQNDLNHHIPDVVMELTQKISALRYRHILLDFAGVYWDSEFKTLRDEFQLVRKYESKLLNYCLNEPLTDELNMIMRADLGAAAIDETYRDHFIHPFQDFLIGVILMDAFHHEFENWYSPSLNAELDTSLDSAWLLTTFFHDRYRPLLNLSRFLSQEAHVVNLVEEDQKHKIHASNLASIYRHLKGAKPIDQWSASSISLDDPLVSILLAHSKNSNHGVLGAFSLLDLMESKLNGPMLYAAALAIALHDREPREDLLGRNIFPVKLEEFPLVVLLLYSDAMQEWKRSPTSTDELLDLTISTTGRKTVTFYIRFGSPISLAAKAAEFASIAKCVSHCPIGLGLKTAAFI
jgi:hypothetical protein